VCREDVSMNAVMRFHSIWDEAGLLFSKSDLNTFLSVLLSNLKMIKTFNQLKLIWIL
jgi:hypothetical protein